MLNTLVLCSRILMSAPDSASSIWDSFRPEGHTDWERAPPSYDLQSWSSLGLNEHLTILYPDEPPWTSLPVRICPPHWNPYRKCRTIWTRFPISEIRKLVGQVWELRDLKPVPLQKKAQIGNFALVTHKVSLCNGAKRRTMIPRIESTTKWIYMYILG